MAGSNLGTAYITVSPKIEGLGSAVNSALGGVNAGGIGGKLGSSMSSGFSAKMAGLAGAVGGIFSAITSSAMGAISKIAGEAMTASDSTDKFKQTLNFADVDTSTIEELTSKTQEYADKTVYGLSDIRNITAQLAANGVDGPEQLAEALGNVNAASGGTAESYANLGLVLTQTNSAGKLTGDNWRQFSQDVPGAAGKVKQALSDMGAYSGDFATAMSDGEISSEEFNQAIMDLGMTDVAQEAATSSSTFEGAMGQLEASATNLATKGLNLIKPFATDAMDGIASFIDGLGQADGPIQSFVQTIQPIGDACAPAFDAIKGALDNLNGALQTSTDSLGSTMPPLSDFIGLIAELAGGFLNGIAQVIQGISDVMSSSDFQSVLADLGTAISNLMASFQPFYDNILVPLGNVVFPAIGAAIGIVIGTFVELLTWVVNLTASFLTWCSDVPAWFQQAGDSIQGAWQAVCDFFAGIPGAITGFFSGIGDGIASFFQSGADSVNAAGQSIIDFFSGIPDRITGFFSGIGEAISNCFSGIHLPTFDVNWQTIAGADIPLGFTVNWNAAGGIFTSPTVLQGVGEAGPEAVLPISNLVPMMADAMDMSGGAGTTYNITINGITYNDDEQIAAGALNLIRTLQRKGAM